MTGRETKKVRDLGEAVAELLADYTGQPADRSWAEKVCRQILDGREVRDPLNYITKAIGNEPERYAPRGAPWDKPAPVPRPANPDGYVRGAALARELLAAKGRRRAEKSEGPTDLGQDGGEAKLAHPEGK